MEGYIQKHSDFFFFIIANEINLSQFLSIIEKRLIKYLVIHGLNGYSNVRYGFTKNVASVSLM